MFRRAARQPEPIAVHIGHGALQMLQLGQADHGAPGIASFKEIELPENAGGDAGARLRSAIGLLRVALRSGAFAGRRIVATLPSEMLLVKTLRIPPCAPGDLVASVRAEAERVLPMPPGRTALRFIEAGQVRQGSEMRQEVILFAALESDVTEYLELLHAAGADVASLDPQACAMYRAASRAIGGDVNDATVVLNVDHDSTQVIIGRRGQISFTRQVPTGSLHLAQAVSKKLGVDVEEAHQLRGRLSVADAISESVRRSVFNATRGTMEALARELSRCLRYFSINFRGRPAPVIHLVGREASDVELRAVLSAGLGLPVEPLNPFDRLQIEGIRADDHLTPGFDCTTALGLAMKFRAEAEAAAAATAAAAITPDPIAQPAIDVAAIAAPEVRPPLATTTPPPPTTTTPPLPLPLPPIVIAPTEVSHA